MSDVLLVNPPWQKGEKTGIRAGSRWPFMQKKANCSIKEKYMPFPFNMAYAAAVLENSGTSVEIIDAIAEELHEEVFLQKVKLAHPSLTMIETSTPSISTDLYFAEKIKEATGCLVALSGNHATVFPKEVLKNSSVDFALLGEYDYTLKELAENAGKEKFSTISGLAYKKNKNIFVNKRRPLLDVNNLPFPARHLFKMELYNENFCEHFPNIQLLTSRGCPFHCVFCLEPWVTYGPSFRGRKPELVIEEIKLVMEKYRPKEIYFDDSTFTANSQRILDICKLMERENINIHWSCMTAANTVRNKGLLESMKSAGCYKIKFGIESASPEVIRLTEKPFKIEDVERALVWSKQTGIKVHVTSMFGLPEETKESANRTMEYVASLARRGLADTAQFSIATPFPGTKFYHMAEDNNWLLSEDWKDFDGTSKCIVSYPNLSSKEIEELYKKAPEVWRREASKNFSYAIKKVSKVYKTKGLLRGTKHIFNKLKM